MTSSAWAVSIVMIAGCGRVDFDALGTPSSDALATTSTDALADGLGPSSDGLAAASCSALASSCGPTSSEPCCDSPLLPGGMFYRSYDVAGDGLYPSMTDPAAISVFRLDRYEITVGRFRQFVAAGMGTQANVPGADSGSHALIPGSGWDPSWNGSLATTTAALIANINCGPLTTWTDAPGPNENRPMNCLSWYDAFAFCIWDGGYLPTEAEWNYAASGGNEQRAFPWSNPPSSLAIDSSTYASYYVIGAEQCFGDMMNGCALTDLVPVGSKPAGDGRWGHSDLAGNVIEWTLDDAGVYPNPCTDCASLSAGANRALRGGGFTDRQDYIRTATRDSDVPTNRFDNIGARCARAP